MTLEPIRVRRYGRGESNVVVLHGGPGAPGSAAGLEKLPADELGNHETWQDALRLQREGVEPQAFGAIRAPVLMLHGTFDPHPGSATRDLLRRSMPSLEYISFEHCGHEPWRERQAREQFLRVLCPWIRARS